MTSTNPKTVTTLKRSLRNISFGMDKHPKWLQEPDWPIVDNIPSNVSRAVRYIEVEA